MAEVAEAEEKGKTIFLDVFRRADKNDDGAVSWDEFKSFFSDGILSTEDLQKLFNDIDTHNTNNLDTSELCEYFLKEAGPFSKVFAGLEDINKAVNTAFLELKKEYSNQSFTGKFITRFLLKEVLGQLALLERHVEVAVDNIDEMENKEGPSVIQEEANFSVGRTRRKQLVNFSQQKSVDVSAVKNILCQEVNRLSDLITKLEHKAKFSIIEFEDEEFTVDESKMVIIVSRKFNLCPKTSKLFMSNLMTYIGTTSTQDGILNLSFRKYPATSTILLYEIWASSDALNMHYGSEVSKTFMHSNIDNLEQPEEYSKMAVPASWWARGADKNAVI